MRRDSTKLLSKRPTACFSGGGGTTTPGLFACNELYSHKKSRYLRVTENSGCRYAFDDVYQQMTIVSYISVLDVCLAVELAFVRT